MTQFCDKNFHTQCSTSSEDSMYLLLYTIKLITSKLTFLMAHRLYLLTS